MGNCYSKKIYECEKCKVQDLIDDDIFEPLPYIRRYIRKKNITIKKQDLYKIYNDELKSRP